MSILCGVIKAKGTLASEVEVKRLAHPMARYATGAITAATSGRIAMGFQANTTHARTLLECGPLSDTSGNLICFDGRLDNFRELAYILGLDEGEVSDSSIALAAFRRWQERSFSRLTGDWALSLWSDRSQRLFLARDHAGTRTLYLSHRHDSLSWATYLDAFVSSGNLERLSDEYAAAYLSAHPSKNYTPYRDLRNVLPGHYLIFQDGILTQRAHWSPLITDDVRYKSDSEYDAHFRSVFGQAVERRTGPGAPILAQLSGGMDSTSIVCMSDYLRRPNGPDHKLLDTLSFYDDSEASLDERTYFTITEAWRGKTGVHLNAAYARRTFDPPIAEEGAYLFPGADSHSIRHERWLLDLAEEKGYKSILSGIGGDEVLGGIPDPYPELASHLVSGHLRRFLSQSIAWSLMDRSPLLYSMHGTISFLLRLYAGKETRRGTVPPWLSPRLAALAGENTDGRLGRWQRFGVAPHRVDNALSWSPLMETLPHLQPQILFRPEYLYPMLDKDLLHFLFSIPKDQLLKPGRRRSLMRRALRDIVPNEILERRRKAFQLRAPLSALQQAQAKLDALWGDSLLAQHGWVEPRALRKAFRQCTEGESAWTQAVLRTIAFEIWLRAKNSRSPQRTHADEGASLPMDLARV